MQEKDIQQADVIVIGAGVLGAFHAYFAAQRGLKVLLLERNALPDDASVRNFGMVPQSIVDPDGPWAQFARDTTDIYRAIQREHDLSVAQRGSLYLASTPLESTVLQEFAQQYADRFGCRFFERSDLLARYPFVEETYACSGLLFPEDLGLDPRQMLRRLIHYLTSLGVGYIPHAAVAAVELQGQQCVVQARQDRSFLAEHVFLCCGADTATLFPEVFAGSGLQVCKLQMMRTVPLPGVRLEHSILSGLSIRRYPAFSSCPSYSLLEREPPASRPTLGPKAHLGLEGRVGFQAPASQFHAVDEKLRAYGIHLLIKQEADGSVVIGDSHQYAALSEAYTLTERTDADINESILGYARSMLRLPSWQLQSLWNGYYLVHEQDPIFTATVDDRIHIVTGIGGKGMSTGPGFARHSVETVLG